VESSSTFRKRKVSDTNGTSDNVPRFLEKVSDPFYFPLLFCFATCKTYRTLILARTMNINGEEIEIAILAHDEGNYVFAFGIFSKLALEGSCQAQLYLGTMFYCGLGVEHDGEKAIEWYLKAAEQNEKNMMLSSLAYHNLSQLYICLDSIKSKRYGALARELGFDM